ncbi:hypothetical protein C8J57DRAFT_1262226 [Mycena rebaudengoi]|nr:hypothetical protein C8J57DRAFT_1262226 [Mycena rebaudengoi]
MAWTSRPYPGLASLRARAPMRPGLALTPNIVLVPRTNIAAWLRALSVDQIEILVRSGGFFWRGGDSSTNCLCAAEILNFPTGKIEDFRWQRDVRGNTAGSNSWFNLTGGNFNRWQEQLVAAEMTAGMRW